MQHERRRFLIALSGIAVCLVIAAGILFSTPGTLVVGAPAPRAAGIEVPQPLPRLPVPSVAVPEPARAVSSRPRPGGPPLARVVARPAVIAEPLATSRVANPRLPEVALPPSTLPASTHAIPVSGVPQTSGRAVADVKTEATDRGPVAAAFVTASTHVGQGFRTVGRTLKNLF